jgi:hypothetical protein
MLQPNPQTDPIIEILILAYQRGLAIRREKEQNRNKTADSDNLGRETLSVEQDSKPQGKESISREKL